MGSSSFTDTIYGYATTDAGMRKAYDDLCEYALDESGSNPYNGTISTTNGVVRGGSELLVENTTEFFKAAQYAQNHTSKWDDCMAFPLREVADPVIEHHGTVTVTRSVRVSDMEDSWSGPVLNKAAATRITRSVLRKYAAGLGDATFTPDTLAGNGKAPTKDPVCTGSRAKVSAAGTVEESGNGRLETRYVTVDSGGPIRSREYAWDTAHTTAARAYSAARKLAQAKAREGKKACIEVVPVVRHVDGAAPKISVKPWSVATAKTGTVTAQLTLDVGELITPAKPTGRTGWMFAGWAAE